MHTNEKGVLGIEFGKIGPTAQNIAQVVIDRGEIPRETVIKYLTEHFNEDTFWDLFGGPAADWIEAQIDELKISA